MSDGCQNRDRGQEPPKSRKRRADSPAPTGSAYWELFEFLSHNHNLTLLDSELEDICLVVERMRGWRPKDGTYTRWVCVNCGKPVGRRYRVKTGVAFWTHELAKGQKGLGCNCAAPAPKEPCGGRCGIEDCDLDTNGAPLHSRNDRGQ
jgi:hypothetical protein